MQRGLHIARRSLVRSLSGAGAHLDPHRVIENLDWQVACLRPAGVSHSIAQVLNHMVFWQEWVLKWLDGTRSNTAGSWRGDPSTSRVQWERSLERFDAGLDELLRRGREESLFDTPVRTSRLQILQTAASHNSYHAGQIVILRQMLGAWPASRKRR
jgi:uncharacterized damage-inducible protein DinB